MVGHKHVKACSVIKTIITRALLRDKKSKGRSRLEYDKEEQGRARRGRRKTEANGQPQPTYLLYLMMTLQ